MKELIRRVLREEQEGPLTKKEIMLFKYIDKNKKETKTKPEFLKFLKSILPVLGMSPNETNFYYELYTANFRPEGDYENLDGKNFVDYKGFKQRKTPNNNAYTYTIGRIPFKGSNLEGRWEKDYRGDWGYVVTSYDWYPIYIYKYKKWFEVSGSYSSSTGKQMNNTRPTRWNSKIGKEMLICSKDEMAEIRKGAIKPDQLIVNKNNKFTETIDNLIDSRTLQTIRAGWFPRLKLSFYYTGVRFNEKMPEVDININKVDKINNNKIDREAGDFFTDNMIGVTKEYLKTSVTSYFERSFTEMLGRDVSQNIMVNITYNK